MAELKCPHCGQAFTVDDTELSSIVQQIRDKEFEKDLDRRTSELEKHLQEKHALEMAAQEDKITLKTKQQYEKEIENQIKIIEELKTKQYKEIEEQNQKINDIKEEKAVEIEQLKDKLREAQEKNSKLQLEIESTSDKTRLAVLEAVKKVEDEKHELESSFNEKARDLENALTQEKEKGKILLEQKEKEVEFYKDLKTKMSTKMVGETLEQHCEIQFNQLRATAFKNAYFEKDNDARTGSKGDYIYRETDENGVEIISIMFEMKNEMDTTATKHKNEDFFKELDKDRNEKGCEYAVLVSLLESDSDLYNSGIVDVSYRYEKMYVVRPQCFLTIISLLRNAAMSAMEYKKELAVVRNQNIDVTNFEERLNEFKEGFSRNYDLAHGHFDKAIDAIDKSIKDLEKVKEFLTKSDNQLRIATNKVEDVSVKKLTKDNPTMQEAFGLK